MPLLHNSPTEIQSPEEPTSGSATCRRSSVMDTKPPLFSVAGQITALFVRTHIRFGCTAGLTSVAPGVQALAAMICLASIGQLAAADPLGYQSDFAQRLLEPHSGTIDGSTLRNALQLVAHNHDAPDRHINIWLDRRVNPDATVSPGELGPTRYASIIKIAKQRGCICYPVHNCVLIGRERWVGTVRATFAFERTTATAFSRID